MRKHLTLLSGSAHPDLAMQISRHINVALTPVEIKRFNDGETYVRVTKSVRGSHVFIIQPTSPPVNDNLIELLLIVDALKRASAKEITAVIPYFGYARQDRKAVSREPISAKLVADMLEVAGVDRVVTFDLHVDQIQGFFNIPVDNLAAMPILAKAILEKNLKNIVVVSPDAGGIKRTRRLAKALYCDMAMIDKRRPAHGEAKIMHLLGDVEGKTAILIDDIIDTAGTITNAAIELKKRGAKEVYICATHAILSKDAIKKLNIEEITKILITDSIKLSDEKKIDKIQIVPLASFIAELINCIFEGEPMGIIVEGMLKVIQNG
jgi:ribose-phosphate pyrophosphokinase